jgi:hypothetical protein
LRSWTRRRGGGVEVRRQSGHRAEDAEPGSARFGPRQANITVKRKQGVRFGEGAVVGGLNSSGSFAVHAQASPFRRPPLQAGRRPGGPAVRRLQAPPWAVDGEDVLLLDPPRTTFLSSSKLLLSSSTARSSRWILGKGPQAAAEWGDRRTGWDWGFIGRSRLGFQGGGWTAGGPWRPCHGHAVGILRPQACSVRGAALARRPCVTVGKTDTWKGERWG